MDEKGGDGLRTADGLTLLALLLLTVWFAHVYAAQSWFFALLDLGRWLRSPFVEVGAASLGTARGWLGTLAALALLGAMGWSAAAVASTSNVSRLSRTVAAVGFGLGLGGCSATLLAMLGLLRLPWLLAAWLLLAVALAAWGKPWRADRRLAPEPLPRLLGDSGAARFLTLAAVGFVLVRLAAALSLRTGEWDEMIYHAAMGVRLALDGAIPDTTHMSMVGLGMSGNYPPLFPALQAGVYVLAGDANEAYVRWIPPLCLAALLLAGYQLGRRLRGDLAGRIAAFLLAVAPIYYHATLLHAFMLQALFAALVGLFLLDALRGRELRLVLAAAAFFGFLALTGYQSFFFLAAVSLFLAFWWRRTDARSALRLAAAAGGVAFATGGFWYLRNWILLGNPVYPHMPALFGAPPDPVAYEYAIRVIDNVARTLWLGDNHASVNPVDALMRLFAHRAFFPLAGVLVLVAAWLTRRRWTTAHTFLALTGVLTTAIIVVSPNFPRYWALVLPFIAALMADPLATAWESALRMGRPGLAPRALLAVGAVGVLLFPGVATAVVGPGYSYVPNFAHAGGTPWFLEHPLADAWQVERRLYDGEIDALIWIRDNGAPDSRIATLDNRVYFGGELFDRRFVALDGVEGRPVREAATAEEAARLLQERDVEYVLWASWMERAPERDILEGSVFPAALGAEPFPLLFQAGDGAVYGVNLTAPEG